MFSLILGCSLPNRSCCIYDFDRGQGMAHSQCTRRAVIRGWACCQKESALAPVLQPKISLNRRRRSELSGGSHMKRRGWFPGWIVGPRTQAPVC